MNTSAHTFILGFVGGVLLFVALNLLAAHLLSDCGLPAFFNLARCADDIVRVGFPWLVWEEGGFAYRNRFDAWALVADLLTALGASLTLGYGTQRLFARSART